MIDIVVPQTSQQRSVVSRVLRNSADAVSRARRPRDLDAYSLERNGSLGRELLAAELESASGFLGGSVSGPDAVDDAVASSEGRTRAHGRHVLLGHSMGAACAAAEAIENPEVGAFHACGQHHLGSQSLQLCSGGMPQEEDMWLIIL
jgi:hypothetical protein